MIKRLFKLGQSRTLIFIAVSLFFLSLFVHPYIPLRRTLLSTILASFFLLICGLLLISTKKPPATKNSNKAVQLSSKRKRNLFLFSAFLIFVAGLIIRIFVINQVAIDINLADMLPLIEKASHSLTTGEPPYQTYFFPYPMPLTFLPGLWLPYSLGYLLNFDPRWIGIFFWTIISILFFLRYFKLFREGSQQRIEVIGFLIFCFLQFSPNLIAFHAIGHTYAVWLWLVLTIFFIGEKQEIIAALFFGLALSSRQTMFILLPLLFFFWVKQYGYRKSFGLVSISVVIFLLVVMPFAVSSPTAVFLDPIEHYRSLADWDISRGEMSFMANSIGLSFFIRNSFSLQTLNIASIIVIMMLTFISFFTIHSEHSLLISMGAVWIIFSVFTPISWDYIYYPGIIILSFACLSTNPQYHGHTSEQSARIVERVVF